MWLWLNPFGTYHCHLDLGLGLSAPLLGLDLVNY